MIITEAIEKNKKICLIAYSVSEHIEKKLHKIIEIVLERYNHAKMVPPIYTCVKELLVNAVKANFKNIYFEDHKPQNAAVQSIEYTLALKLFKLEMSRENAGYLEELARKWNIQVKIYLWVANETFFIKVVNPAEMTAQEMKKVQQKLADAASCEDIAEYFLKVDDDSEKEGAGLGLVMISMMLKSLNLSSTNLAIEAHPHETVATLIIPLNVRYSIIE